ncbi:hypothetical protein E4U56_006447 [Claviceps arundinis]|uniref:Uncharacterized protein n=1 Tax=Claviceps arundinis TaxID=1623583 RepID=A0A9P7MKC7_9HYPO|nr:hypothetical protein E4U56_006447 [Claviceps arundinis]
MTSRSIDDDELHQVHPKIITLEKAHEEVRMIFRKVLSDNGVLVNENLIEDTADPSEEDYAANLPELPSVDRTDVGSPLDKTSSDSNKKEEKLPEGPASALPECVHFEEKQASVPTADLDDKPYLRENVDLDDERHKEQSLAEPPEE